MKSGIYLIKNIINKKVYIGSAVNIDKRWKEHKKLLKQGKHHSKHLQYAWNIDGQLNFKFEIIEEVSNPLHLLSYEQVYLDYYKSYERERGYNICKVAGSMLGIKHSKETKQKMSKTHTGKRFSEESKNKMSEAKKNMTEETKQKMSETHTGKILSEEHKNKIGEANTGRKHTEETKQKISEAHIGRKLSEEHKKKLSEVANNMSEEHRKKLSEAKRNSKKYKYYSFNKDKKKYRVKIWGKDMGYYNTEEEAKQAVVENLEKLKAESTDPQ